MGTIIKQSADGIILSRNNNFDTNLGKVFINNHEITDIDTFFKVAEENTRLLEQVKKQKEVIDKIEKYIEKQARMYGLSMPIELGTHLDNILGILNEVSEWIKN